MKQARPQFWSNNRHVWLLVSLVMLEVLYPLSRSVYDGFKLLELFFALVFFACIFVAFQRRASFVVAVILAVPSILCFALIFGLSLFDVSPPVWLVWARLIATAPLLCFSAGLLVVDALKAEHVKADTICAAISVYLMVGAIWAIFYSMAVLANPESILLPDLPEQTTSDSAGLENFSGLNYFSFVTLSTLGYGEIVPMTPVTRMLAWVEAMFGQIYLAVLVAHIVGLHVAIAVERRGFKRREE